MQSGPGTGQGRDVAVGPSRVVAARVFGTVFDDAHITSYADFAAEVQLDAVGSVGLVGTEETSDLLTDLLAGSPPPKRVLLGLPDGFAGRDEVLRALQGNPGVRPAQLIRASGVVVVPLAPGTEVTEADAARVLAELRALEPAPITDEVAPEEPAVAAAPGRTRRSVRRLLSRLVVRLSRKATKEP